jgi:hypothetical protein
LFKKEKACADLGKAPTQVVRVVGRDE